MSIDRYDPIRILGEGSFGKVYLMRDKVKRNFVCVKIIKIKNIPKKEREATRVEVDLLRRLNHPNIVRYVDSFLSKNGESLCICMEYCDGGDLASQIKAARRNLFSESKILHWFVQLALGLHYMHGNKVLHRDLKTQNVFMLGNGRLVLGDLGISKVLDGTMDFAQTCIGTPYYMSPEIFKNKPYSYKSDVWALGCVLYEMTTLNHAFDANSLNGLATKIVKGKYPPISPKYSKHLSDLIAQMLQLNPQQRPDLDQILRKPFIKKHIVNFFTDIAMRPSNSIGEGTMVIKAAVGGPGQAGAMSNDSNMISLRQQLHSLGLTDAVADALAPKSTPQDDHEALRQAKEQAMALQREKEHKKSVEAALEKLRQEREARAKALNAARPTGYGNPQQVRYGAAAARNPRVAPVPTPAPVAGPPSARNPSVGAANHANIEAARREAVRRQQAAEDDDSVSAGRGGAAGAVRRDGARRRSFGEDNDRPSERDRRSALDEQRRQEEASRARAAAAEERRREEARAEARAREEQRVRDEQRAREEARAKEEVLSRIRVEQIRIEQVRAQAEAAAKAKREAAREKERARQREEIEQLKRDKLILDQRAAEKDRQREVRREQERVRLEGNRREQVENSRREQLEVMQEKLGNMNDQIARIEKVPRPRPGPLSDRAEEKEEVSARERVLQRRQEKQAKDEAERLEQLRAAEQENRRLRQEAHHQARQQYHADGDYNRGAGAGAGGGGGGYEFDGGRARMDSHELHDRLSDATKGRGDRYDSNPPAPTRAGAARSTGAAADDYDSDSDVEASESVFEGNREEPNAAEEEEDMIRREEELRAELNFANTRVEELKRTLQETKSFLGPRLPTRGRDNGTAPMTAKGMRQRSEDVYEEVGEEEEDEDDLYFDESDEEDDAPDTAAPSASSHKLPSSGRPSGAGADYKIDTGATVRLVQPSAAAGAYGGLQDMPSPSGRLSDRIERLRQRCTEALGRDAFRDAYQFLKQHEEESQGYDNGRDLNDEDYEAKKIQRMRSILGEGKAHYMSLIEQLIFMEETHMG